EVYAVVLCGNQIGRERHGVLEGLWRITALCRVVVDSEGIKPALCLRNADDGVWRYVSAALGRQGHRCGCGEYGHADTCPRGCPAVADDILLASFCGERFSVGR